MIRLKIRKLLFVFAGLLMQSAAAALTLDDAYLAARDKDFQFLANQAYLESMDGLEQQAVSTLLPSITLDAERSKTRDAVISGQDSNSRQYGISLHQSLINPKLWKTKGQAEITLKRRAVLRVQYDMDLMARVATAYFDVITARAEQQLTFLQNKLAKDQFDLAQQQFLQGLLSEIELQDARIRQDLARTQWAIAQHHVLVKQRAFRDMTGVFFAQQINVFLKLPDSMKVFESIDPIDLTKSPSLGLAQLDYEYAQLDTEKYRMEHMPTVDLSASWNKTQTEVGGSEFSNHDKRVSLSLSVPIFSGFLTNGKIQEAKSIEKKAFYVLEEKRTSLQQSINQVKYQLETSFWLAAAQFSNVQNKEKQLEYQQVAFEIGSRTTQDVLYADIQKQLVYVDALKARFTLEQTLITLESLMGTLSANTLAAISKRLSL